MCLCDGVPAGAAVWEWAWWCGFGRADPVVCVDACVRRSVPFTSMCAWWVHAAGCMHLSVITSNRVGCCRLLPGKKQRPA